MTNGRQNSSRARTPGQRRRSACGPTPSCLLALLALWIALALVFNGEPEIDQRVSSLFFAVQPCAQGSQASACGIFPAAANAVAGRALRNFFHYLPIVVAVVVAAILARDLAAGRGFGDARVRFTATALAGLSSARA